MKRIICILVAAVIAAVMLTACGQETEMFDRIDTGSVEHVTLTVSPDAEKGYDIVYRKGVVELVEIYNTATFVAADEVTAGELTQGDEAVLYTFRFCDYDKSVIGECSISPKGYIFKGNDLTKPYKLTSDFDEDVVKECIELYDKSVVHNS